MKRKGIIISIIGIIIVALSLLGITFGYYYTQIFGNENATSVKVTSAMKAIKYIELSEEVSGTVIKPGYEYIKTFAATSLSTEEEIYHIYLDEVINEFTRTQDITYTLYRKSGNNTIDTSNLSDCEEISSGIFPKTNSYIKFNEKLLTKGDSYTYALKINYLDSSEEQDIDDGKTFGFKVQLHSEIENPYKNDTGTLKKAIVDNAIKGGTDKTTFGSDVTTFTAISGENERVLNSAPDDYGTSYYYRGNVLDNYVTFADMCWRIVRINGDGTTKLILEDQDQPCSPSINGNWAIPTTTGGTTYTGNFGYTRHSSNTLIASNGTTKNSSTRYLMDYLHGQTNSDKSMGTAFKNFQSTFTKTELSKLKAGNWCLGDNAYDSSNNLLNSTQIMDNKIKGTSFNYDSYQRLGGNNGYQPTLKCNGTIMNDWDDNETNPTPMYVGAITADEVAYAGGEKGTSNQKYYLINEEFKKGISGANKSSYFWSLSPARFDGDYDDAFRVSSYGRVSRIDVFNVDDSLRPAVSLASSAVISEGEGTLEKPYKIG